MDENNGIILIDIKNKIYSIRNMQVILDRDLAKIYGIETRTLKQAVKRNLNRFPLDFMFALNEIETNFMVSQNVIPSKQSLGGSVPYAFTQEGIAMLSSILNNEKAIQINIQIMRTFVYMRQLISQNSLLLVQKINNLETKHLIYDTQFEKIFNALENNKFDIKEGVFFEGQIFDAYVFVSNLIRNANKSIILIDNYIDDSVLILFTKRKNDVKVTIYTENISKELRLDLNKYNLQYDFIDIKQLKGFHDRFLVIDDKTYHFGASLKDLGKKLFAFSKFEKEGFNILERVKID